MTEQPVSAEQPAPPPPKPVELSPEVERLMKISMISFDQPFTTGDSPAPEPDFTVLGEFHGKPISESYKEVVQSIDETEFNLLIFKPQKIIVEFKKYFLEKIPSKVFFPLLNTWPPAISQAAPTVKPMVDLIQKMIQASTQPTKIMAWFMSCIAPRHFSSSTNLLAATWCKSKKPQWVLLNSDSELIICEEGKKGLYDEKNKGKAAKAEKVGETDLKIFNEKGTEIFTFTPADPATIELWLSAFTENKPNFIQFLTTPDLQKIPGSLNKAILSAFSAVNSDAICALFTPGTIKQEDISSMMTDVMNISQFNQKVNLNLNAILTAIFEQPKATVDYLCNEDPLLASLFSYYGQNYAAPYAANFIRKVAKYFESKGPIDFENIDPNELEKTLFTSLKYILASIQFIPPKIQHLCSMIKSYATIKFNSYGAVFRLLSTFYTKYLLCPILRGWATGDKPTNKAMTALIKTAMTLGKYETEFPRFAQFDKRLSKLYKTIENFILELAVIFNNNNGEIDHNTPPYTAPESSVVVQSCDKLYNLITKNISTISPVIKYQSSDRCFATSTLGWAFASSIQVYFKTYYEDERNDEEKVSPSSTVFDQSMEPHMCTSPDKIPQEECNTGKSYVRVKKRVKMTIKGSDNAGDQVIAVSSEEVVSPDGKKKTIVKKKVHRKKQPSEGKVDNEQKESDKESVKSDKESVKSDKYSVKSDKDEVKGDKESVKSKQYDEEVKEDDKEENSSSYSLSSQVKNEEHHSEKNSSDYSIN
ncbi:hypothetical protein TVAG_140630 [Trichomonas vaginalis G3]|uniref:Ras-GAP domain-containing protein n=1 Tax=Trichomonas vaginalis (strain ATCC PRA-98 / G3) TaxID=412133 RepID=A2EJV1_TRIV3|nr:hypothetical protein TVAGG3_0409250 [Trichomonas vaginalis G3]EAY07089.1 hypothetical protein TVAG_140630 [Trichomonas vaginalis G3]KAI5535235.1 hypothetical protein TVAGG3_0409250 [Trichomonas vaginalis G3]|eukprot:XP_001319312.1 hypothetical protein [Trichomonas vaginalis G3]